MLTVRIEQLTAEGLSPSKIRGLAGRSEEIQPHDGRIWQDATITGACEQGLGGAAGRNPSSQQSIGLGLIGMWASRAAGACRAWRAACSAAAGVVTTALAGRRRTRARACQGVPVGYGIRERVVARRWPAYRGSRWRPGRLADGGENALYRGASVKKATMRMSAPQLEPVSGKDANSRARSLAQRYPAGEPAALSSRVVATTVSCAAPRGCSPPCGRQCWQRRAAAS
jgi:hypothetical protein